MPISNEREMWNLLDKATSLPDNFDDEGAKAVSPQTIVHVRLFIDVLYRTLGAQDAEVQPTYGPEGSVDLQITAGHRFALVNIKANVPPLNSEMYCDDHGIKIEIPPSFVCWWLAGANITIPMCSKCSKQMRPGQRSLDVPGRSGPLLFPIWLCSACDVQLKLDPEKYDEWQKAMGFTPPTYEFCEQQRSEK